ncbi:probable F420-dependent oxidoreductase, MSMEG_2516 family [Streptosporangium canum]|uniref:Probable F420-dependent oxidoreductase, MSMEG_2516 family n=1 Tax=Streptosporangium canum TaxID=324952 RepID=A0A1I3N1G7_9ACTN|nr:LLM class flavin-dependent oxidoreductase [Streptosporangium canum]SFJ02756.1 probable F420-dependent oxidoreductase, MSMEG_2516 family [Streptosporangium canum]
MTHPFSFSLATPGVPSATEWRDLVRRAEDLGYDGVALNDHVGQGLEAITALASAAALSTRLTLALRVANLSLRNPVELADAALSLDALSGGRFQLGVGAGWLASDAIATGSRPYTRAERLLRVTEAIEILGTLLRGQALKYTGTCFTAEVAEPLGTPVTGRVPLTIGAASPRMLTLAARHADIISIMVRSTWQGGIDVADLEPERLDEKVRRIAEAEAGRETKAPRNHVVWECLITPRPEPVIQAYATAAGKTPERLCSSPGMLIGSPAQVAEELLRRRDRWGLTDVTVPAEAAKAFAPVLDLLR